MATLAPQKEFNVAFPENVTAFLYRRAKRDHLSVPQTLTAILTGVMEDEKETADPVAALLEFHESGGLAPETADDYLRQIQHDRKNWGQCPR